MVILISQDRIFGAIFSNGSGLKEACEQHFIHGMVWLRAQGKIIPIIKSWDGEFIYLNESDYY